MNINKWSICISTCLVIRLRIILFYYKSPTLITNTRKQYNTLTLRTIVLRKICYNPLELSFSSSNHSTASQILNIFYYNLNEYG